jgi:hypothetical protein
MLLGLADLSAAELREHDAAVSTILIVTVPLREESVCVSWTYAAAGDLITDSL